MSHYTGHHSPVQTPRARVAFFGGSLVAMGFLGFYTLLHKRHERKHLLDRTTDHEGKISTWESRMIRRAIPASTQAALRAARVEARSTPLPAPTSSHNSGHRTFADDAVAGRAPDFSQPTAQKAHADGRGVYTKNPGWREAAHFASALRAARTSAGEWEQEAAAKVDVKSVSSK